jgi:mono/diheme cytochrome c family protein
VHIVPITTAAFTLGLAVFNPPPLAAAPAPASASASAALAQDFAATVRPFLDSYCVGCHGAQKPKGDLDLSAFTSLESVVLKHRQWATVAEALRAKEMPPAKAKKHPAEPLRAAVVAWIEGVRRHEARSRAGDPGPVLARRLSNAEYDYTIRDLLGHDLRPTREFPVDPANEAGFDNSGESLAMSPALLKKYLDAARGIAEHVVLTPGGIEFAPHQVVSETDRDKFGILRVIDFYKRQPTDLAGYFTAAWRYRHRAALGKPRATLADCAAEEKVSPKYLGILWPELVKPESLGPLAKVQAMFQALPVPSAPADEKQLAAVRAQAVKMRDFVVPLREKLAPRIPNLKLKAVATGSQPFIIWKNQQMATHRTSYDPAQLYVPGTLTPRQAGAQQTVAGLRWLMENLPVAPALAEGSALFVSSLEPRALAFLAPDPNFAIPAGAEARAQHEAAFARFARVFPDAFVVSERGRIHMDRPKEKQDKGRFLSMGGHNMFGFFRDDIPLYQMVLDRQGQRELDRLWQELYFITDAPRRTHADFIFYERAEPPRTIKGPEFDFIRSEDKASASPAMIRRLAAVYVKKARESLRTDGGDAHSIPVLEGFFKDVTASITAVERQRRLAEPRHLEALTSFAERAYRRPLTGAERRDLLAFYRSLRQSRGGSLSHEEALRDTVASVLVSPSFLYRLDLLPEAPVARARTSAQPLPDFALASRLSYFLWSSMPDKQLLDLAAASQLRRPDVLAAQTRRMLLDPRARALAVEFGGNWLDFRRFEEHNSVDRGRFPAFDNQLRQAMFEEPVRFFLDVVQKDRSVLDFVHGKHTFVNASLARHYGMPVVARDNDDDNDNDAWVRVDDADRYQRGGILPMAVFLTKNAPGLRTSPVKRGYWVVRRALGEQIPAPPAQVPDLPNDEKDMGHLTLRQVLAKHREDPSCAGCHARFDSFGLVFEGYGPVGELRRKDLGGRPVDTRAPFPVAGGKTVEGQGLEGLRAYIKTHRQGDFLDNLSRKLLSYALGRGLQLSDEPTLEQMRDQLAASGFRFGSLVQSIVGSPQFLTKRARGHLALR